MVLLVMGQNVKNLTDFQVSKVEDVIAVTTPIPAQDGRLSKKTSVFHLPVYKIKLEFNSSNNQQGNELIEFYCDLADLTDFISQLKAHQNCWR